MEVNGVFSTTEGNMWNVALAINLASARYEQTIFVLLCHYEKCWSLINKAWNVKVDQILCLQ